MAVLASCKEGCNLNHRRSGSRTSHFLSLPRHLRRQGPEHMPQMHHSLWAYCATLVPPRDFRRSHFRCQAPPRLYDVRDPSSKRWNCGQECWPVILPKCWLPLYILGIFYMPQICDMGLTALLHLQRKACWGFFRPEKSWRLRPGLNPRTWVLKGSMLPLDHWSRFSCLTITTGLDYCGSRWYLPWNSCK